MELGFGNLWNWSHSHYDNLLLLWDDAQGFKKSIKIRDNSTGLAQDYLDNSQNPPGNVSPNCNMVTDLCTMKLPENICCRQTAFPDIYQLQCPTIWKAYAKLEANLFSFFLRGQSVYMILSDECPPIYRAWNESDLCRWFSLQDNGCSTLFPI